MTVLTNLEKKNSLLPLRNSCLSAQMYSMQHYKWRHSGINCKRSISFSFYDKRFAALIKKFIRCKTNYKGSSFSSQLRVVQIS